MIRPHVLPRNDLIEHEVSDDCACGPVAGDVWIVVHHSLDRRELREVAP